MNLFEQTTINQMKLKNRIFRAATWENLATETGHTTPQLIDIYENLAKGGIGTIITGYSHVVAEEQPNPGMLGIYDDSFIEDLKKLMAAVHRHDANIVLQVAYGGSMTALKPPSKHILGPSAVTNENSGITPIAMTDQDIQYIEDAFVNAGVRAQKAGFDGVELHVAHGYLLSSFLTPYYNRRTDAYGGTIENRVRIVTEIVEKLREKVGPSYPILIKLNAQDFVGEEGLTEADSLKAAALLEQAGVDAIEVSGGNESFKKVTEGNLGPVRKGVVVSRDSESYFAGYAKKAAQQLHIPIILTGGNRHMDIIEDLLNNHHIAYFGMARPFICEPDLVNKWKEGTKNDTTCVSCSRCHGPFGLKCVLRTKK